MRSLFISPALLLLSLLINAQDNESIVIGKKETIYSSVLNENRVIWIYTPNSTSRSVIPGKSFPVLYLLDGDAHFYSTVGIIQQLSQANGNGVLPEMIVVAIKNTDRLRDFVPLDDLNKRNPFIDFLSSELIPYINQKFTTAPYKLLAGHSLGGLTVINILTKFPELFNAYIAIDPSMWYANEKFLNNTIIQLPRQNLTAKRLFIGTANTMPKGMTISQLKTDHSIETQHIRSIFKLDNSLKASSNGLLYAQKYYDAERHNTVSLLSQYDGLRFIFDFYHLDATERDFADSTALFASKLRTHYANVSEKLGYKDSAPEAFINYIAFEALEKKQYNKAEALFKLNIEWYPESHHAHDSYAHYFLAKKDTGNAIANYRKALTIKNDSAILMKLNALTNPKFTSASVVDLQNYAGTYTLVDFQLDIVLAVRGSSLWAVVPGQADDELELLAENVFTVKGKQGYTVTFSLDGGKPKEFTSVQPNGTFKAVFKKK